ncbi:hypothetical protein DVH24_021194 [Malus domestica]|uniref:5'-3' DNA helicase ZGRF1-like N-terminal domain-containing protein n=1 Tax=Malus domestica TaxID=3750 RepID=A0A498KXW7_MALDO|nr:hypothetical protein DVH24_021194 [Malus domestica]
MAEVKRWSVTYTKHMKQKRKVYQDGSLELNASTNKMLLFDDCEKLLECRILKKDEQVSCGETLTFNSFLVDVNEALSADGDRKPVPGFDSQAKDEKRPKPFVISRNKPQISMSPSQKIIRGDYTSMAQDRVVQKRRILPKQFSTSGSYGKQVELLPVYSSLQIILLDASRNQIDCRFLKKDEVVASVEIGEREGDRKPVAVLHIRENKHNVVAEAGITLNTLNRVMVLSPIKVLEKVSKMEVLYTTQITQKAKKYHDGFLKLAMCGSKGGSEDKTMLSSKHINLSEDIRQGCMFELPKYLVEVGEPYASSGEGEGKSDDKDCLKKASNSNHSISSVEETKPGRAVPTNKPLRDAHQILSILQKPKAQESKISITTAKGSHVSDAIILDSSEADQPSQPHRIAVKIEPSEKMDTGKPPDLTSFRGNGGRVAREPTSEKTRQLWEADTKQRGQKHTLLRNQVSVLVFS